MAHDQHLRGAEQCRRAELGDRPGNVLALLIAPQRPHRAGAVARETPSQQPERALDEVRLLAEQQVVGAWRAALEGLQRIGRRRPAQKPSIACW
jgi:hypothetical protein